VINLVTIELVGVYYSMRAQPEMKMVDMNQETLEPEIADEMYVKFQRNPHIFCIEEHSGTNVSTGRRG